MKPPDTNHKTGPLQGLRVLDLSRILAGPTCTQLLGDMGAEIIKIERPGKGDDTRGWGPPFLKDENGNETSESAYYLSSNRNKFSAAIDLTTPRGQKLLNELAGRCDILVENFKAGDLKRRGLDYASVSRKNPGIIYCSITGFGQTGPYADRPGYDFLIQGMGGIMSLTGKPDHEDGEPTKCGVGIADVMCGMYASVAVLAALRYRDETGEGQHIDLSLFDTQIAWLINQGAGYLVSGEVPPRRGNEHPTIVPYGTFQSSDGNFIIAVGNDEQFKRFCLTAGMEETAADPKYSTNPERVRNRRELIELINGVTINKTSEEWLTSLGKSGVPCGPVNDLQQVFSDPQVVHREMKIGMNHPLSPNSPLDLIGNPVNFSKTPVTYRKPPPIRAEDTRDVLTRLLELSDEELAELETDGIIESRK